MLDYQCALQRARADLARTEQQIDAAEDKIDQLRVQIDPLQRLSRELSLRHLTLRGLIELLEAHVEGKHAAILEAIA